MSTDPLKALRQTGRTTRMINAAILAQMEGKKVALVFTTEMESRYWQTKMRKHFPDILILDLGHINRDVRYYLDWHRSELKFGFDTYTAFIDHYAIETRFKHILQLVHQWDGVVDYSKRPLYER